jgi:hypothetical protein
VLATQACHLDETIADVSYVGTIDLPDYFLCGFIDAIRGVRRCSSIEPHKRGFFRVSINDWVEFHISMAPSLAIKA